MLTAINVSDSEAFSLLSNLASCDVLLLSVFSEPLMTWHTHTFFSAGSSQHVRYCSLLFFLLFLGCVCWGGGRIEEDKGRRALEKD